LVSRVRGSRGVKPTTEDTKA